MAKNHSKLAKRLPPRLLLALTLVLAAEAVLLSLAHWQYRRYQQRTAEHAEATAQPAATLSGTYLPDLTFALTHQPDPRQPEQVGWRLLGVLQTSTTQVIVDRGFTIPPKLPPEAALATLAPPTRPQSEPQTLHGQWHPLPTRQGWLKGPLTTTHPRLLAFLEPTLLTSTTLAPELFVLTQPDSPSSSLTSLPPPGKNPLRHLSYMIQWALMALILPLLAITAWRRHLRRNP